MQHKSGSVVRIGEYPMQLNFRPVVWVTVEKASELTGRSVDSFNHLVHDGRLIEGTHWKWSPDNRRHINLEAYDEWVATSQSKGSTRGRRPSSSASSGTAAKKDNATDSFASASHLPRPLPI
ncbi:protein of unknown function [Pararobbsia alpina]